MSNYVFDPALLSPGRLLPGYRVDGDAPDTWSLSIRWSAVDNLFLSAGYIAAGEWSARNLAEDSDSAEREQSQFVWALPIEDVSDRSTTMRADQVCHRQGRFGRGIIPPGCGLAAFMDLGKYACHWAVVAGASSPSRWWLVDSGVIATEVDHLAESEAITVAMRQFYERMEQGFADTTGAVWSPGICLIDSGAWSEVVYQFMGELAGKGVSGWWASKGHGLSQDQGRVYTEPGKITDRVMVIGDRYHIALQESKAIALLHMDVDYWKSRVHAALNAPIGEAGSLVLCQDDWRNHMGIARALLSEVAIQEFVPDKGVVTRWKKRHRNNHWLDCVVGAFVGLDYLGLLSMAQAEAAPRPRQELPREEGDRGLRLGAPDFGGMLRRD